WWHRPYAVGASAGTAVAAATKRAPERQPAADRSPHAGYCAWGTSLRSLADRISSGEPSPAHAVSRRRVRLDRSAEDPTAPTKRKSCCCDRCEALRKGKVDAQSAVPDPARRA